MTQIHTHAHKTCWFICVYAEEIAYIYWIVWMFVNKCCHFVYHTGIMHIMFWCVYVHIMNCLVSKLTTGSWTKRLLAFSLLCVCVWACVCLKMRKNIVWPFTKDIIILSFVSLNMVNIVFGPFPKRYSCVCVYSLSII